MREARGCSAADGRAPEIPLRHIPGRAGKSPVPMAGLDQAVGDMLDSIQADMLAAATTFRDAHIHEAEDYQHLTQIVTEGWAKAYWCGNPACESKIKDDTKATSRNIPQDQEDQGSGVCIVCGEPAEEWAYWARAY